MSKTYKRMELKKVPYTKLLKLELPELATSVIRVIKKHDYENLLINDVFEQLRGHERQIDQMSTRYGVNPFTAKIALGNEKVIMYVGALKFRLRVINKEFKPEMQAHASVFEQAFHEHFYKLGKSPNNSVIHRKVAKFLQELIVNVELMTAVAALSLNDAIDDLSETLSTVLLLTDSKAVFDAQRTQESTGDSEDHLIFMLKVVFKQIEVAMVKNTELDYSSLFNELNEVINVYRSNIRRRKISNKRKAEQKKALEAGGTDVIPEVDVDLEGSDEPTPETETNETMAPGVHMTSTNGDVSPAVEENSKDVFNEGLNDDLDQSLDQKKTAASSSKNMQLPDVNDEA